MIRPTGDLRREDGEPGMSRPASARQRSGRRGGRGRAGSPCSLVLAYLLPYQLNVYWISVADTAILFALLAVGMGLVMGIAGQVNLAQIAFFGVGAYATAILTTHDGYGFWTAAVLAVIATALTGIVVGTPALRVQSHYLGIVTLGLAVAFIDWITNAPVTNGDSGISGIPVPPLFGIDLSSQYLYYYLELVVLVLGLAFGLFIVHSPLGRRMRAMRDDPLAASAAGSRDPAAADDRLRARQRLRRRRRGAVRRDDRLHRPGDVQHRRHVPAARDGHHRRPAVPGGLRHRRGRAHRHPAGADQPGRLRAARLRARGGGGRGVRPGRPGRDPRHVLARCYRRWRGYTGTSAVLEPFQPLPAVAAGRSAGRATPRGLPPGAQVPRRDSARRRLADRPRRRDPRHRRPQRLGQDHAVQRDQRLLPAARRHHHGWPDGRSPAPGPTRSAGSAWRARSSTCGCSAT